MIEPFAAEAVTVAEKQETLAAKAAKVHPTLYSNRNNLEKVAEKEKLESVKNELRSFLFTTIRLSPSFPARLASD